MKFLNSISNKIFVRYVDVTFFKDRNLKRTYLFLKYLLNLQTNKTKFKLKVDKNNTTPSHNLYNLLSYNAKRYCELNINFWLFRLEQIHIKYNNTIFAIKLFLKAIHLNFCTFYKLKHNTETIQDIFAMTRRYVDTIQSLSLHLYRMSRQKIIL